MILLRIYTFEADPCVEAAQGIYVENAFPWLGYIINYPYGRGPFSLYPNAEIQVLLD